MKVQCSCGAKYEFDIAPAMTTNPVRFVCPACGADASEFVDSLVRRELGQTGSPSGVPQPVVLSGAPAITPNAPSPIPALTVRVNAPPASVTHAMPAIAAGPQFCAKHPGELAAEKCCVCSKPICPKCMALFGYVCSPLCRARAESHGINVPVFAGQKAVVERRFWRKVGWMATALGVLVVALVGFWTWFTWVGAVPKAVFSVRFPESAYSGQSFICGKDQIVFLHGGTLARHDLKLKKEIWSRELLDHTQIAARAADWRKQLQDVAARTEDDDTGRGMKVPSLEKLTHSLERNEAAALELFARGTSIWVAAAGKLVRYEWDTGTPVKEVPFRAGISRVVSQGDDLLLVETDSGKPLITRVNLTTCAVQRDDAADASTDGSSPTNSGPGVALRAARESELAGLPTGMPGRDAGKALDPAKVAAQAQHLSYPQRLALPATLAVNLNQERTLAELSNQPDRPAAPKPARAAPAESTSLVPSRDGFVQFSVRLLESRIVERSAMKAPPKKSALDNLTVGNTQDAANEVLNEMQRSRGGDKILEDESRYAVTLRRPGDAEGWTGEVVGPPALYPLQTVNVLAAGKMILVFDKSNKKLWQSSLSFNVRGGPGALDPDNAPYGQGPCVERGGTLYLFDEGVLTAFDLPTGDARWRLPSVGIAGLFFADGDTLYVNTTTASPESLKYSRQIDISQKVGSAVLKVDSRDGKVLWSVQPGGLLTYVSGKFLYTVASRMPEEADEDDPSRDENAPPPYLRIRRISPKDGHMLWEHYQARAPVDIQFDKNTIRLVFRKEVQVLRFLAF